MDLFWVVTLFNLEVTHDSLMVVEERATNEFEAMGIEEYSLSEAEVDALLGERSYSGGDLPESVLDEVEDSIRNKPSHYRFFFGEAEKAVAFLEMAQKFFLCEAQVEECVNQDWNAEWKRHYSPIKVNDQLEVVPSWETSYVAQTPKKIYINPGMGFGTGSHETTYLCLRLLTEKAVDLKVNDILDFGSGSGILGLSAMLFYPEARVDFYDIDAEANKNCFENARINGLAEKPFRLLLPEVRNELLPSYQIVFANILENILLLEKETLISKTANGGYLILSGLLKHQVGGIEKVYQDAGMTLIQTLEKGDWGALILRK